MRKILLGMVCIALLPACKNEPAKTNQPVIAATEAKTPPPMEFADQRFVDMSKKAFEKFAMGDIDGWLSDFTDNARYYWSGGDSLIGKQAIMQYWKNRRMTVVDSIQFSNEVWLPIKVNEQTGPATKGNWVLCWHQVHAKYKNGKQLNFWVHTDLHFNDASQIDQLVQYVDRAPINAALSKK